jgi:hypothetical protein
MFKRCLLSLLFLLLSLIGYGQNRLQTVPRSINREDNPYGPHDRQFLGEEYSQSPFEFAVISHSWGNVNCLRSCCFSDQSKQELVYLVSDDHGRNMKEYRCPITWELYSALSGLIHAAVFSSYPDASVVIDGACFEFLDGDTYSAQCWLPASNPEDNCPRLVRLIQHVRNAVKEKDLKAIEALQPEIQALTDVFNALRIKD